MPLKACLRHRQGTLSCVSTLSKFAPAPHAYRSCAEAGLSVCPPLDLEHSQQYDLLSADIMLWIVAMLREGRLGSAFCVSALRHFQPCGSPSLEDLCRTLGRPLSPQSPCWEHPRATCLGCAFLCQDLPARCRRRATTKVKDGLA